MRVLCLLAVIWPASVLAEDVALFAQPTAVTVYPTGALIARAVPFDVPEGRHRLILSGLPDRGGPGFDVALEGARLLAATYRQTRTEAPDALLPPEVRAAKAALAARRADVAEANDRVADLRAAADAAAAQIAFLAGLGDSPGAAALTPDALSALVGLIGAGTAEARRAAIAAEAAARQASAGLDDLRRQLREAERRFDLLRGPEETAELIAWIDSPGGPGTLTVRDFGNGTWQPVYDIRLDTDRGEVVLDRSVLVRQAGPENWTDVALTVSTDLPGQALAASDVFFNRRSIEDAVSPPFARAEIAPAPMAEAMVLADTAGGMTATYDGLAVTYTLDRPVTILRQADEALFRLDSLAAPAEVFAAAIPQNDTVAYVTAEFETPGDEILLPSTRARVHIDGRFIGTEAFPGLVPGEVAELGFGPVPGLVLTRVLLDQMAGDRGVLSRTNVQDEAVRITVENRSPRAWPVRLRDAVYFGEQEDLRIEWTAVPPPDAEGVDDRRGVLEWRLDLAPGAAAEIRLDQRLTWPEDKVLR